MKERLVLAAITSLIVLSGVLVSNMPPLASAAPVYQGSCDWSPPAKYWPVPIVVGEEGNQTRTTEDVQLEPYSDYYIIVCGYDCDDVFQPYPYPSCCSSGDNVVRWDMIVKEGGSSLWASSSTLGRASGCGCLSGCAVSPVCQQTEGEFTTLGTGEVDFAYCKGGMWHLQPFVSWQVFGTITDTAPDWYYPLIYSDTLNVTQQFNPPTHYGVDFSCTTGRPVFSVYTGTVLEVGYDTISGWYIDVDHGELDDGHEYVSHYAHLGGINVEDGEAVGAGCQIGWSDDTGYSTGPHLHFGLMQDDTYIDPEPFLELYPDSCRSDCGGLDNAEFLTGTDGWTAYKATWSASTFPSEGIVNLVSLGRLEQDVFIASGETRAVNIRARAYNDSKLTVYYGVWILDEIDIVGDGEWHVYSVDVTGAEVYDTLVIWDPPYPGNVVAIDWVCLGYYGGEDDVSPPTSTLSCNLVNYDFSSGESGWSSSGSTFAGGIVQIAGSGYIEQDVSLPVSDTVAMVQVVARSVSGSTFEIDLEGETETYSVAGDGAWHLYNWAPTATLTGTLTLNVSNTGSNPIDFDYICVLTSGTLYPPENPWARCEQFWPGDDWLNVGKWIQWLWCQLEVWLGLFLLMLGDLGSGLRDSVSLYEDILNRLRYEFQASFQFWAWMAEDWPSRLLSLLYILIRGLWLAAEDLWQWFFDLLGLIVLALDWLPGDFPFDTVLNKFFDLLYNLAASLQYILEIASTETSALLTALDDSATADLGLPDPENTSHPLYPFWIGINLVDAAVTGTPYQYLVVVAMGALGLRLFLWAIVMLTDW